jgi:uracil permease
MVGAFFGGCPNTTYGESIGCVAITKNASVLSIIGAAVLAIVLSFFTPVIALINTIPACVSAASALRCMASSRSAVLNMLKGVDLNDSDNLFVVSIHPCRGHRRVTLNFGDFTVSGIATALILGIVTNFMLRFKKTKKV